MLRILKYLYLANFYKKAKSHIGMLILYGVVLLLVSLIMNDLISVSQESVAYFMLLIKWVIVFALLWLIVLKIIRIFTMASQPFSKEKTDSKKEHLLSKKKLLTQSEQIMEKYVKAKHDNEII
ncbi:hypothetical protein [Sulfurimonas hydrogeniphila]|uniref:hypothetical protein n=1 Tax=Sulfurimonas hydrogeniphila TaxID=2509341 RepID=UPI00126007D3|nr:hypothetical protein [Sulfurimonas hydrogeniphila]